MSDFHAAGADGRQHAADVVDLVRQRRGVGVPAVEVFAADADTDDPVVAVLPDGGEEGCLFGFEMGPVFGPDADEELGVCREGGGDGACEGVTV